VAWIDTVAIDEIEPEDVIRWDHGGHTYAIYRTDDDAFFASDGLCTHEGVHLADGLLQGHLIECPGRRAKAGTGLRGPEDLCCALDWRPHRSRTA
jgi:3-phenylpropionate/trans-cinnamate dioxygenase ferredoxin component